MSDVAWWWVALGAGLVVALVALVLLHTLLTQVRRVERAAQAIWETGKQVAANTATTWQLQATSDHLDDLSEEAGRHERLLRGRAGEEG